MPYRGAHRAPRPAFSLPGPDPEAIAYHLRRASPSRPAMDHIGGGGFAPPTPPLNSWGGSAPPNPPNGGFAA